MKLFKFLAGNVFNIIGAFIMGLGFPSMHGIFVESNPLLDTLILVPIGLIFLGVSFYYKFIEPKRDF